MTTIATSIACKLPAAPTPDLVHAGIEVTDAAALAGMNLLINADYRDWGDQGFRYRFVDGSSLAAVPQADGTVHWQTSSMEADNLAALEAAGVSPTDDTCRQLGVLLRHWIAQRDAPPA